MSDVTQVPAALLVIDAQMGVLTGTWNRDRVVANIAGLVKTARARDVPVIWIQHDDDDLVKDSPSWGIVPELGPVDGEPIVFKRWCDSFAETALESELRRLGARRVILCGAQTDGCVRMTMHGALSRGYPATLVEDAHTTEDGRFDDYHFTAEWIVAWQNRMAMVTAQLGAAATLVIAEEAFDR